MILGGSQPYSKNELTQENGLLVRVGMTVVYIMATVTNIHRHYVFAIEWSNDHANCCNCLPLKHWILVRSPEFTFDVRIMAAEVSVDELSGRVQRAHRRHGII